jgi:hypothetical protein
MTSNELGDFLVRINTAADVPQLAQITTELIEERRDDKTTANRLLLIAARRWKKLEARN